MARSIVVGTDGSEPADEAVRQAIDLASREGARLHLVTAYHDPQIVREITIWTNDPKGMMDTGRTEHFTLAEIDAGRAGEIVAARITGHTSRALVAEAA